MPQAEHLISRHILTEGVCFGGLVGEEAVELAPGDVIVFPQGDAQLDQAAPVSLNADAPLTCQFMLEDHAVRHSYHHLDRIRTALQR